MDATFNQVTSVQVDRTRGRSCAWTTLRISCANGENHEVTLFSATNQPVSISAAKHPQNDLERAG